MVFKTCLALIVLIVLSSFLARNEPRVKHTVDEVQQKIADFQQWRKSEKDIFIEKALNTSIDGEYDGRALSDLCRKKEWKEGLIFSCEGLEGGLGNVRNIFLSCVRYAIESGGKTASLPILKENRILIYL